MKTLVALLLLLQVSFGFTQQVIVANEKQDIVYCGVSNPLSALATGYSCELVVLKTTNGKIEKKGCGRFNYIPDNIGLTKIEVWVLQNKKLLKKGDWPFRVKMLPSPVAFLTVFAPEEGRQRPPNKDTIYKQWLSPFSGIRTVLPDSDYEAIFNIVSYTINAFRNGTMIFSQVNTGSRFEVKMIPYFDSLQAGDQLIFSNIICTGPSLCNRRNPEPIKFYVAR